MIDTLAIAMRGFGYGTLAIASRGFVIEDSVVEPSTRGDIIYSFQNLFVLEVQLQERPQWSQS